MIPKSLLISLLIVSAGLADNLTLEKAIKLSLENDPWLIKNKYIEKSIKSESIKSGTYEDPKISIGLFNLPTDGFDFNQEAMTQFKVGITQKLPRGDTLEIKEKQLLLKASKFPYQRENRKLNNIVNISQLWFDIFKTQETITIIERNRQHFEQLVDIAESTYSSGFGRTRQQDIIRAELELTNLDDRITILKQKKDELIAILSVWLYKLDNEQIEGDNFINKDKNNLSLNKTNLVLINHFLHKNITSNILLEKFENHPLIKSINKEIAVSEKDINLAKQKYKPQFGLSASYAYRGDDLKGNTRADLFSAGVTFDIPIFTKNRQDKELESTIYKTNSIKSKKSLQIRKFLSSYEKIKSELKKLKERETLYLKKLIPQTLEQTEAALNAYTSDDGDFAEVARSRIAQLNREIDVLNIKVAIKKNIIQYNYLFSKNTNDLIRSLNNKEIKL